MPIAPRDIPAILLERIEEAHSEPGIFAADETDDWPQEVLPALLRQGAVAEADRAQAITCPGCEWQCHKRVVVRRTAAVSRAFIMCDEEPDHGRIQVPMTSLTRVAVTLRTLSQVVAGALDIGPPKASPSLNAYSLGTVKGRNGDRLAVIEMEHDRVMLAVGEQREPMTQVLKWGPAGLAVDTMLIRRLADRKEASSTQRRQYVPDRSQQTARKAATRKRNLEIFREAKRHREKGRKTLSSVAEAIAKTKLARGLSAARVLRIITEQRGIERKNSRSKPKRRK